MTSISDAPATGSGTVSVALSYAKTVRSFGLKKRSLAERRGMEDGPGVDEAGGDQVMRCRPGGRNFTPEKARVRWKLSGWTNQRLSWLRDVGTRGGDGREKWKRNVRSVDAKLATYG